jgi:hypothetical protein|tara:strand:+ start:6567 stop:6842 length:276 start_codon:yes stop_codon:yes gene_type:complete
VSLAIEKFEDFYLVEKKGDLKKLVGKEEDEELTVKDAKKIGVKVANMDGLEKKKYVGIMNFLGASCNIYNTLWKNYTKTRDAKDKKSKKNK